MIKTFTAAVAAQAITVSPLEIYVSETGGVYEADFSFSSDWDGLGTKKAVFQNRYGTREEVDIVGGSCTLPASCLMEGTLYVGAYGTEGSKIYPTRWASIYVHTGALGGVYHTERSDL